MAIDHSTGLRRHPSARRRCRAALAFAAAAALAGCTVTSGPNEIAVEHFVDYPGVAAMIAEQHCAKFGKQAKLVQAGLQDIYAIGIRKRVSVYHCVDGAPPAAPDGAKPKS